MTSQFGSGAAVQLSRGGGIRNLCVTEALWCQRRDTGGRRGAGGLMGGRGMAGTGALGLIPPLGSSLGLDASGMSQHWPQRV